MRGTGCHCILHCFDCCSRKWDSCLFRERPGCSQLMMEPRWPHEPSGSWQTWVSSCQIRFSRLLWCSLLPLWEEHSTSSKRYPDFGRPSESTSRPIHRAEIHDLGLSSSGRVVWRFAPLFGQGRVDCPGSSCHYLFWSSQTGRECEVFWHTECSGWALACFAWLATPGQHDCATVGPISRMLPWFSGSRCSLGQSSW